MLMLALSRTPPLALVPVLVQVLVLTWS